MKALQIVKYGEIKDSLGFNEISKPTIQANDVLIEVKAAAINPIDKSIILGNLQGLLPIPLPSTSAYDVSGIVVEKGNEVSNFEVGDMVYSRVPQEQMGTLAEFVAVTSSYSCRFWRCWKFRYSVCQSKRGLCLYYYQYKQCRMGERAGRRQSN